MTFPKNRLFPEEDQVIARISSTLSHPARLFIARTLRDEGPKFVHDLERIMPLTQPTISHHLAKMVAERLLKVEEQRLFNLYSINIDRLEEIMDEYEAWYTRILGVRRDPNKYQAASAQQ